MSTTRLPIIRSDASVLIVEDEPRLRELLQRAIGGWGFGTVVARSGEEAMRLCQSSTPDIALLDLNLPGMDGLELFERLKSQRPMIQGIVLTGFASVEAARQAIHLEVVEFLTKPCHLGDLERALDRALRKNSSATPEAGAPMAVALERKTLNEVEREHILAALERNNNNRTATAEELGISRRTLYYKLEEYGKE